MIWMEAERFDWKRNVLVVNSILRCENSNLSPGFQSFEWRFKSLCRLLEGLAVNSILWWKTLKFLVEILAGNPNVCPDYSKFLL